MAFPCKSEMGSESRPFMPDDIFEAEIKGNIIPRPSGSVMPVDVFEAAIKGNSTVLLRRLGLQQEVTIEITHPTSQQIEADQHHDLQDVIGSVTHFGDTLLHLLVTNMHNELALMVFKRDMSLMKARNKKSETPLHCAANAGNVNIIKKLKFSDIDCAINIRNGQQWRNACDVVKDAVRETDNNGDTALHLAAKHGHEGVARELMKLDPGVAYMFNKEGLSPFYIAMLVGGYTPVKAMLEVDPSLACEQYSNGMYPVHVAAGAGNIELVMHFMRKYPDDAKLLDHCRRNFFHIAAEKNEVMVFKKLLVALKAEQPRSGSQYSFISHTKMVASLINARDYDGNTPLHIATIKGHTSVMNAISELLRITSEKQAVQNNQGLTPFELWRNQLMKTATKDMQRRLESYIADVGCHFTEEWFDKVIQFQPDKYNWERIQVIGLGSVLITTVAFAAAFAIPGGYNQDNGTPILGRKYMFKAFILANTQSFIQAFASIFTLIRGSLLEPDAADLQYATDTFISAAGCMMLAFGLGSYVMLAPINLPIAIIVLVSTLLLGSPFVYTAIESAKFILILTLKLFCFVFSINRRGVVFGFDLNKWILFRIVITLLYIFFLALA